MSGPMHRLEEAVSAAQWRQNDHGRDCRRPVLVANGNGTTIFGKIVAGTVLGKTTATGKSRPCFKAALAAAAEESNTLNVGVAALKTLYVGDTVKVLPAAGGGAIAEDRVVQSKSPSAGTFVVDGAAITAAIGDIVSLQDGAETAIGITERSIDTHHYDEAAGSLVGLDRTDAVGWHGWAKQADLVGWNSLVARDLGAIYVTE